MARALEQEHALARPIAERLPPGLRFGTSTWSFPGWAGIVYSRARSVKELAHDGLLEYAQHPLLTTVGIDRSFYAPVPDGDYLRYARQLPPGFQCVSKAPHAVMSQVFMAPGLPEDERGPTVTPNPDFLSVEVFEAMHARPLLGSFREHAGPVLLEMPPVGAANRLPLPAFLDRLDRFLSEAPRGLRYAVELRERAYLTPAYAEVLRAHGVAHAYSYWRSMPLPGAQAETVPVTQAPFVLVRLSLKPGRAYEADKARFAPFNRIVEPDPRMRAEVVEIVCAAAAAGIPAFVLVNNKAEGSSPLTVRALAEQVAEAWAARGGQAE
ncbi:DUF72 domain-containing protein [Chondromyces crocatus]|uniref:DUF72 domain-containing protein n=1 Tax=Chondromyces crocatus TaxID=52 RepID=A0A0K1EJK4_CHOCO|nr:DUF72 domain-containing protein [Chondromyces crocatus]AKT40768.1 uncharacterized protein CMC5_049240 [Chondromyces crocatus]